MKLTKLRLRTQLIIFTSFFTFLITSAFIVYFSAVYKSHTIQSLYDLGTLLTKDAAVSATDYLVNEMYPSLIEVVELYMARPSVKSITVLNRFGEIVADSAPDMISEKVSLSTIKVGHLMDEENQKIIVWETVKLHEMIFGYVKVELSTREMYRELNEIRLNGIITGIVIWVISLLTGAYAVARMTKSISQMSQITDAIAKGDLTQRAEVKGSQEISHFSQALYFMADTILERDREQQKTYREMREIRNYLRSIIDYMPSILISIDKKGTISQWNLEAERLTGIGNADAIGISFSDVMQSIPVPIDYSIINKAIEEGQLQKKTKLFSGHKKDYSYYDITVFPISTDRDEGIIIRIDDATERVKFEDVIIQSEKMLSIGGLSAGMAHELNNPLAGIIQTTQVVLQRLTSAELKANQTIASEVGLQMDILLEYLDRRKITRQLKSISELGVRAKQIIDNMLSFGRQDSGSKTYVKIGELVDKTLEIAASDYDLKKKFDFKSITITKEYDPDIPAIWCESSKLQQVFFNLFNNGAQAMSEAGTEKPCFLINICHNEERLKIEIGNNGPSIPDEHKSRIFEPFFTTKPTGSGTGLGLSVSYFIITNDHKGVIRIDNDFSEGVRFIIELPILPREKL